MKSNYTTVKEGANEITARLSCLPSTTASNLTKWYSINVTGVTVDQNATADVLFGGSGDDVLNGGMAPITLAVVVELIP